MTAMVGTTTAVNILYGAGLYNNVTGVDLSPITGSVTIFSGSTSVDQTWIGYFTPASSGTTTLSLQTTANESGFSSASTTGQLWVGSGAITGSGAANITANNNQTSSANFAMTQGVYYPVRIRWTGSYSVGGFFGGDAEGSIIFLAAASSDVTNRIFYNTFTNGF
jgi:hypothetical protein